MKLAYKFLITLGIFFSLTAASNAAHLDFTEIAGDPSNQSTLNLTNATLKHDQPAEGFIYLPDFGDTNDSVNGKGSICAIDAGLCRGTMSIEFTHDIHNLFIGFAGGGTDDEVFVSGWKDGSFVNFTNITSAGVFDFSFLGIIDKIILFNDSPSTGFLYQDFTFDTMPTGEEILATPLPAALPMFGAALGLLGFVRHRQNRRKSAS